jgi:hypothetical protein
MSISADLGAGGLKTSGGGRVALAAAGPEASASNNANDAVLRAAFMAAFRVRARGRSRPFTHSAMTGTRQAG